MSTGTACAALRALYRVHSKKIYDGCQRHSPRRVHEEMLTFPAAGVAYGRFTGRQRDVGSCTSRTRAPVTCTAHSAETTG